jgi:tetratricopeptide (TPR) repeat protein
MNCKYHTQEKAQWYCHQCDISFCINCCDINPREIAPRCLLCRTHLESYGVSDKVTPFWNKLSEFNKYPWQKNASNFLMIYMGLAFVIGLLNDFIPITMINWILSITLYSIGIGYVFKVLTKTAKGKFDSPSYDEALVFQSDGIAFHVFMLYLIIFLSAYLFIGSYASAIVFLGVLAVTLPAILIILAMEKHLISSLDPIRIMGTIKAIGWPYFILAAFSYLIDLCFSFAQAQLGFWLPQAIAYPLIFGALAYFYIVKFNMFGYVAFQYHNELGYGIDAENLIDDSDGRSLEKRLLAKADVYIQEGRFEDAEDVLYDLAQDKKHTVKALERLVRLNIVRRNPVGAIKAANNYYQNPNISSIGAEAVRLYQEIIAFEPHFKPTNAKARAVLINHMKHKRYAGDVKSLTSVTEKMQADVNLPWLMLARARFESEVMNDDQTALNMLNKLLSKYPRGSHQREAEQLRQVCQSMQQKLPSA